MPQIMLSKPVAGSPLTSVELVYEELRLDFGETETGEPPETIRVFFPQCVDNGRDYIQAYFDRSNQSDQRSSSGTANRLRLISLLGTNSVRRVLLDPALDRRFSLDTLTSQHKPNRKTTFDEIREFTENQYLSNLEFMLRLAGGVTEDQRTLISNVHHKKPEIQNALPETHLREFHNQLVEEILELCLMVSNQFDETYRKIHSETTSSQNSVNENTTEGVRELERLRCECIEKVVSLVLSKACELEKETAREFSGIVAMARKIHDHVGKLLKERGWLNENAQVACRESEFRSLLNRVLDFAEVDQLLVELMARLKEMSIKKEESLADLPPDDVDFLGEGMIQNEWTYRLEEYSQLRDSSDPLDKWAAITSILLTFVDRSESVRLLLRTIEQEEHLVLSKIHLEIYKKVRNHLTQIERRLFLLMYCGVPALGRRPPVLSSPLLSFFLGMDAETQALILLVCVFKITSLNGIASIDDELRRRFHKYLKFYPWWTLVNSDDDKERKWKQRHERNLRSLTDPSGLEDGLHLEDIFPDPLTASANPLSALASNQFGSSEEWIRKYCSAKDVPRMVKYYDRGMLQREIALEEGISQQAVSLTLKRGYEDLVDGLMRDGYISEEAATRLYLRHICPSGVRRSDAESR